MRYPYTPIRKWLKSGTLITPNAVKNVEQQELSFIAGENARCYAMVLLWKTLWWFLNTKHILSIWPSNPTPWYLPRWVGKHIHTKICTWMFIVTWFITAKTLKLPRCPLADEGLNKLVPADNEILLSTKEKWVITP